uniref:Arginine kinase n=1 Tax=Macrostomum lignano TaxID=282301 RepID=A0A1I8FNG2_9PLAT
RTWDSGVWRRDAPDGGGTPGFPVTSFDAIATSKEIIEEYHGGVQAHRPAPAVHAGRRQRFGDVTRRESTWCPQETQESMRQSHDGRAEGHVHPADRHDEGGGQQQLIDDHFLLQGGDRFPAERRTRAATGPTGRASSTTTGKTFLVWVGRGEDHMRIISMQKGAASGGSVCRGCWRGGQEAPASGWPTRFQLQCTVRGSAASTRGVGGLYDISNKRKAHGPDGVRGRGKMYRAHRRAHQMRSAGGGRSTLEVVKYSRGRVRQAAGQRLVHSLLKKHLTKEWRLCLCRPTENILGQWAVVPMAGVENLDSGVGVYARTRRRTPVFADLFDPIIEEYTAAFKRTDRTPPCTLGDASEFGDVDPEGKYVVSTRIRLRQVAEKVPGHYKEMEDLVSGTLKGMTGELKGTFYPADRDDEGVQQQLIDDHFLFKEGDRFLQKANACRYWPTGRASSTTTARRSWCEEDHMRIISMQKGGSIREGVRQAGEGGVKRDREAMEFSHDDRLGFLTFCRRTWAPRSAPRCTSSCRGCRREARRPCSGWPTGSSCRCAVRRRALGGGGGLYDISNKERMGLTEFEAVGKMYRGIGELIKMEKELEAK